MVSILVFLDQALKDALIVPFLHDFTGVSILVFLDQALKESDDIHPGMIARCFNPCFPGSSAESACAAAFLRGLSEFQSLFSWIKR